MTQESGALRSHRPGEWFGIAGEQVTLLLPATEKPRAAALWSVVDDGAAFDEVLDALLADGLRSLPAFALAEYVDGAARMLLRGPVRGTVVVDGETVELDGSGAATWVEGSWASAASISLVAGDSDVADRPLDTGLLRVSRVDQPPVQPEPAPVVEPAEAPVAVPVIEPADEVLPETADEEPAEAAPDLTAQAEMEAEAAAEAPVDEAPVEEPAPLQPPSDVPPPPPWLNEAPAAPPAPPVDLPTEPLHLPPPPPMPPAPPAPPAPPLGFDHPVPGFDNPVPGFEAEDDHDGHTSIGPVDPDRFARSMPGIPGQPQAPAVTAQPVATLVFSHGESVDVDRVVIIGRSPEARRFTTTEQPRLVTVPSRQQEISSTHLEIRPGSGADHGSAVATDLGSTNGTVLQLPGLPPESLQPGIAVQLLPGSLIDLGDGITIQVTHP